MTKLEDIKTSVRALLEDESAKRFPDALLEGALRQTLDEIEQRLPRILRSEHIAIVGGREQPLVSLTDCRYIISITLPAEDSAVQELEPESSFTYRLAAGVPTLHFLGKLVPAVGDTFTVCYASGYSVDGFLGQTQTSLPASLEHALVIGTAATACFLRAGSVIERYGGTPQDSSRLVEIGNLWRASFERALNSLKVFQEFGFPPGFALDRWDIGGKS